MHGGSSQILEILVGLLLAATLIAIVTRQLRLPYTVGLVLMGLLLGLLDQAHIESFPGIGDSLSRLVELATPSLIIGLFVTPLVFEAAFHLNWDDLRRDLPFILALAVPGVALTTLLVGGIITAGTSLSLSFALVFGALISATDPVAVVALFRSLGIPKRLQVLLEGESLFNDGTAIVLFTLVLNYAVSSSETRPDNLRWISYLAQFIRVSGGGLVIGLVLGWMVSQIISKIDDHLIETTLTTLLAYAAFFSADQLGVSGILAVVAAGLVNGNMGPRGMSPTTRIVVRNFWEYAAFLSNSFLFLLIGLEMNLFEMISNWRAILLAILAVLLARAVIIYGTTIGNKQLPKRWSHILLWGGLRGAISLALALSLRDLPSHEQTSTLRVMAFGVVLFTIVVQGFTMQPLVRSMRLIQRSEEQEEYERRHARAVAARSAYEHIQTMYRSGLFSYHTWQRISPLLEEHAQALALSVKEVLENSPDVEAEELDTARRESLRAQRSALINLFMDGIISEENYTELAREVDMALDEKDNNWSGLLKSNGSRVIERLMTVVIQIQDYERAQEGLNNVGISVTRISSTGGFLGRRNVILLIGISEGQEEQAVKTLSRTCRRRVEYIATPLEGAPFHLPLSTPVTVGGATIFTMKVDHYEEM